MVPSLLFFLIAPAPADGAPGWEPTIHRIIHLSLDEQFTLAHALTDSLLGAHPDRPEPAFYKAAVYWRQGMNLADGHRYDPAILNYIERAITRAERQMRDHGESAELFLWLGNGYGLRTGLRMLRREVIQGVMDGFQGRGYLAEALQLDADLIDAQFGLGLSDYILATNPRILRVVQRLLNLPSGDRRGGLEKLERVVDHGNLNAADARSALAYIDLYYERDKRSALTRIRDLRARYPNSLDYRIREVDALLSLAVEQGDSVEADLLQASSAIRRMAEARGWRLTGWRNLKLAFTEGFALHHLGRRAEARPLLAQVASADAVEENWLVAPAEIILGNLADLEGNRERALDHYRRAERLESVWGSRKAARRYLVRPYDGSPRTHPPDDEQRYPERP